MTTPSNTSVLTFSRANAFVRMLLAFFSGAIATYAFAPFSFWPAMLVSLISFLSLLYQQSAKRAAWIGFFWGIGQFGTGVSWVYVVIDQFGGMALPLNIAIITLLILYLSLFPALFAYFVQRVKLSTTLRYLALMPVAWIIIDALRGWLLTGFPWLWAGYSQIDGPLKSLAPIFGVQGITFALVLMASSVSLLLMQRRLLALLPIASISLISLMASQFTWVTETGKTLNIAMVQGNIPQEIKWDPRYRWPTLLEYRELTQRNLDADIIIWPEAAVPAREDEIVPYLKLLDSEAKQSNTAIITGLLTRNENREYFNSVIAFGQTDEAPSPDNIEDYVYPAQERYNKHHLLIFGEFVPFGELLRPLTPLFNLPMSSFTKGEYEQSNINAKGYQFVPAICYEIAFGEQVRNSITSDSDFILTVSNDTWFGDSIGPHQHLEIAQMRALENGKPVLRSTNTGITAAINYDGAIINQAPQFETTVLRTTIPIVTGETPYTRFGSLWLYLLLCFFGCLIAYSYWQQRGLK